MESIEPRKLAHSIVELLSEAPHRYRNFGVYWYFIKAFLKRAGYTKDNLYLLGDFSDESVSAAMPQHESLDEALSAAVQEYRNNAQHNLGRSEVFSPDGDKIMLFDEDAGL